MMRFLFIYCFIFPFHFFGQSIVEKEVYYLDSIKKPLVNYNYDFLFLTDSAYAHQGKWLWSLSPEMIGSYAQNRVSTLGAIAFNSHVNWKQKIDLFISFRLGYSNTQNTAYQSILQAKAFFTQDLGKNNFLNEDIRARLIYKPNKYVNLQTGIDKHKIGQGDRSLLMGDQGISNPFLLLKANIWKLEYLNLQQIWREGRIGHYVPKGNSTHVIQFNHKHHFSIGIFETVTHIMKDTIYNRGFDLEYLNPFIFYRPQEYSLGSSDNVLLGILTHVKFGKSTLYGQIALDEFLLSEIRAHSRWWANKYAIQLGYKWAKIRGDKSWFIRSEFNLVRPYTYAHLNTNLNYGNQGLPSAHPLGANFIESYNEIAFNKAKWTSQVWLQICTRGADITGDSLSYGADIYKSYIIRPIGDYGINIGNGNRTSTFQIGNKTSWKLNKNILEAFIEPRMFWIISEKSKYSQFWISAGIQSRIGTNSRNY